MIKSVRVDAYNGTYEVIATDNSTTLYTDRDVSDDTIAFIQNEEAYQESLSSAVSIYTLQA